MQNTSERRQAFIADDYVLDGPDGPIAPTDWNDEVYPGISVTIQLKNREVQDELEESLSQATKTEQSLSRLDPANEDTGSLFGDDVGEKGAGAGDDDADSTSNKDRQSSSAGSSPDGDTSGADGAINVFDYLESEEGDDKYLEREDPLGVMNPFLYQVPNDAWKTKVQARPICISSFILKTLIFPLRRLWLSRGRHPPFPPPT
jgi:hypothetical protein